MKLYLIRHSGPFVKYEDEEELSWDEFNSYMILSVEGEERAKKLCDVDELSGIKNIYASMSNRAIATAKYVQEKNNTKIKLDKRINERVFGIKSLSELPKNFTQMQFEDKDLKLEGGESLNEVSSRFNNFINEIVEKDEDCILFIHGILLLNYLSEITDFSFDGNIAKAIFNKKIVKNGGLKNPDIFRINFENKIVTDVKNIEV